MPALWKALPANVVSLCFTVGQWWKLSAIVRLGSLGGLSKAAVAFHPEQAQGKLGVKQGLLP